MPRKRELCLTQIASDRICLKLSVFTSLAPACGEKEQLRRPVVYLAAGRLAARAHRIMRRRCAGRARLPASIVRTRVYEPATRLSGDVLFDEIGVLQSREFNREAPFSMWRTTRPCVLPTVTITPTNRRTSGPIEMAAPEADRSMTWQPTLLPAAPTSPSLRNGRP